MANEIATASERKRSLFQRLSDYFTSQVVDVSKLEDLVKDVAQERERETVIDGLDQGGAMDVLRGMSDAEYLRLLCVVARVYGISTAIDAVQMADIEPDHGDLGFDRLVLLQRVGGLVAIADMQATGKDRPEELKKRIEQLQVMLRDQAVHIDAQRREVHDSRLLRIEVARLLGRSLWHLSRDEDGKEAKRIAIKEWDPSLRSTERDYVEYDDAED